MSKRKRTEEEIEMMQARAVRLQENVGNYDAAIRIENLTVAEYAAWRDIEIVWEPVRKRRRTGRTPSRVLPPGYARRTEIKEWTSVTEEGGRKAHREVKTEIWKEPGK